jgi:hypothetical protein
MSQRAYCQILLVGFSCLLIATGGAAWKHSEAKAEQDSHERCQECGLAGSGLPCICIQYPMFYNGMYYLYYAHRHEDCDNCSVFDPVVYASANLLEAQDCQLAECPQGSAEFTDSSFRLQSPIAADFDFEMHLHPAAKCQLEATSVGSMRTPTGRIARIKVFHLKCANSMTASPELVSVGFEVEDDGNPAAFAASVSHRFDGYEHVYAADVENRKCVVLTTD